MLQLDSGEPPSLEYSLGLFTLTGLVSAVCTGYLGSKRIFGILSFETSA